MDVLIDIFVQIGAVLMLVASAVWTLVVVAWGAIWAIMAGLFWLAVALLVCGTLVAIFRPALLQTKTDPAPSGDATLEQIRAALRTGELDADIARINSRNASRGRL